MRLWTLHPKHLDARGLVAVKISAPHPLFKIVLGTVRDWERVF